MAGLPPAVAAAIGEGSIAALNDALPPGFDLRAFWRWQNPRTGAMQQRTLLHVAAHHAAVELVLALLNAGCDVNAPAPDDGYTPLHCACAAATSSSSARAIAALLRAGAGREARCALGRTPCELLSLEPPSDGAPSTEASELAKPEFMTDDFRMFRFKIEVCPRLNEMHDWTSCPFQHPGEKARRRDPRQFRYQGVPCPDFRKGVCKRGEGCTFAHGVFECWLHPSRYRTQLCKEGAACKRSVCFFAHAVEQLREPTMLLEDSSQPGSPRGPLSGRPAAEESLETSREESVQLAASTDSVRGVLRRAQSFGMAASTAESSTCGTPVVDSGMAAAVHAETLQRTLSHLSLTNEEVHQVAHAAALQAVGAAAAAAHHHAAAAPGAAAAAAFGLGSVAAAAGAGWPAAMLVAQVQGAEASLAFGPLGLGHHAAQLGPLAQAALAPGLACLDPSMLQVYQQSQLAAMQVDPAVLLAASMHHMPGPLAQAAMPAAALGAHHAYIL